MTTMIAQSTNKQRNRSGTTLVEAAIVLPVFLTFVLAIIEFGHAQLVHNMLNNACRTAARMGSVEGTNSAGVVAEVNQKMAPVVDTSNVSVFVNDASIYDAGGAPPTSGAGIEALPTIELSNAEPRLMFVVRARVNYNDIAIVPVPFLQDVVLNSQAFMRHE